MLVAVVDRAVGTRSIYFEVKVTVYLSAAAGVAIIISAGIGISGQVCANVETATI